MSETKTGRSVAQIPASCEWEFKSVYGKTLARFKLHYGDLTLKGFRIMDGPTGPWVAFPSVRNPDPEASKRWVTTVWLQNKKRMADFKTWALRCYDAAKPDRTPQSPEKAEVTQADVDKVVSSVTGD